MKKALLINFLLFVAYYYSNANITDSTLSLIQFKEIVKKYHPVIKLAQLEILKSENEKLIAQGNFDPVLKYNDESKTLNAVNYYKSTNASLQIPTWYGIDVYAGINNITGSRLDNSETNGQTSYIGLEVPLLKNLIADKRRTQLKQSEIIIKKTKNEKMQIVNDILLEAIKDYCKWLESYELLQIADSSVKAYRNRLVIVKKSYQNGERPAIDTTETLTQLIQFETIRNTYQLQFINAGLELSKHLWTESGTPYWLPDFVIPKPNWDSLAQYNLITNYDELQELTTQKHPVVQEYKLKTESLLLEQRLKKQDRLPKLNFIYNQLGKNYNLLNTVTTGPLFENNFKYGLKFEMPIRMSTARGLLHQVNIKIQQTDLEREAKLNALQLKLKNTYNNFTILKEQIILQRTNCTYYQKLTDAEQKKYLNGESTIFMINSRETKTLEAQEKLINLKIKLLEYIHSLQWAAGILQ